ncbi:2-ketoacid reductase [Vibrio sp. 10N.286.49.B3]|uniref:D-2-hydroxyacid dehydrogenase n=1 Tax=Vibrio sp. 10N.286.49.B3 TaxID=1880855 RepID=UPI000C829867|nr:D-2-hydroxyacid dehydrogenase [Vibrio sp. 10N.286.49.B3]PMH46216.1 2-ketoacid reductase [Vibrio sp. 10N.286.49.B3]
MNNFTHKVYILTEHDQVYKQLLEEQALPNLEITEDRTQATILLASPPLAAKTLDDFTHLEWLQSVYAGVDALIKPELAKNYTLTNVKGIFGQQISEYVLGYSIAHYRQFHLYQQQQQQQVWQAHSYPSLSEKTMLILGTGSIASHLATTAKAFGIRVLGINRTGIPPKHSPFDATYHVNELNSVLRDCDIVVNTLPKTDDTINLLDESALNACQGSILFNVGRGDTVNSQALLDALESDCINHAFLDVFINEPISQTCPYWQHPKVTVTPHIAALSFPAQVVELFSANYHAWHDGFSLNHQVEFERGY